MVGLDLLLLVCHQILLDQACHRLLVPLMHHRLHCTKIRDMPPLRCGLLRQIWADPLLKSFLPVNNSIILFRLLHILKLVCHLQTPPLVYLHILLLCRDYPLLCIQARSRARDQPNSVYTLLLL